MEPASSSDTAVALSPPAAGDAAPDDGDDAFGDDDAFDDDDRSRRSRRSRSRRSRRSRSALAASASASASDLLLFYLSGVGASLPYIASLSSLVYLSARYGPDSYVYLNLAVYCPLVPVSLLQARYDQEYDVRWGSWRAYLTRGVLSYAASAASLALLPLWALGAGGGMGRVVFCAALMGAAGAALQGALNQMASFVSPDPRLKAAVSAGLQSSAFVALLVSLLVGFGSSGSGEGVGAFFLSLTGVECLLFGSFVVLMRGSRPVERAMLRRDSSIGLPLLEGQPGVEGHDADRDGGSDRAGANEEEVVVAPADPSAPPRSLVRGGLDDDATVMPYPLLYSKTSIACLTLVLTLIPSFMVGSWFTHVRTSSVALPQILFYARIASDLLGRFATIGPMRPASVRRLFAVASLRILVAVLFFVHAAVGWLPRARDAVSVLLVAVVSSLSGYLVTGCYQLAPALLSADEREGNATRQAGLLNVAFSGAAMVGVSASLALSAILG